MGLDAFVNCNCFKDGKTSKPPFDRNLIVSEDGYLELSLPYEDNQEIYQKYWDWLQNCCAHPNMKYLNVGISNWSGYRTFQEALGKIGWEHFPILKAGLPEGNGGSMPFSSSIKALEELNYFEQNVYHLKNNYLVDSRSGQPIYNYIQCYGGTFILAGGKYEVGIDEKGFFVIQKSGNSYQEIFRATSFTQEVTKKIFSKKVKAVWVNVENQKHYVADVAINVSDKYPTLLNVEWRNENSSDYGYILKPLQQIFEASRITGNPVYWS